MKEKLTINDVERYRLIVDIANTLGKDVKAMQHGYFPIKGNLYAWCPQLAYKENGVFVSPSNHGWINIISDNGKVIIETRDDSKEITKLKKQSKHTRVTFVKDQNTMDGYRFIGIFVYDEINSTKEQRIYLRISSEYEI